MRYILSVFLFMALITAGSASIEVVSANYDAYSRGCDVLTQDLATASIFQQNASEEKIVRDVLGILSENPEIRSADICSKLSISIEQLKKAYAAIRDSKELQRALFSRENENVVFDSGIRFYLKDKEHLLRILRGETAYPRILEFHPGVWCRNACVFCYSMHAKDKYHYEPYGRKLLSPAKAAEIVRQFAAKGTKEVWVSGGLDPLWAPETTKAALRTATEFGLTTRLYTNGHEFDNDMCEVVVNCSRVRFYVGGFNQDMYEAVHRTINPKKYNLNTVLSNATHLIKMKKDRSAKVQIGICYMVVPEPANYKQILSSIEIAHKMGFDFFDIRVDMANIMGDFKQDQVDEIMRQIDELKTRIKKGDFKGMRIHFGRLSEEGLKEQQINPNMQRATKCYSRLAKMVVNPYGVGFVCDYVEHPKNVAAIEKNRADFEVGDFATEDFEAVIEHTNRITHTVKKCEDCGIGCLINETVANTVIEKFDDDMKLGISPDEQPFNVEENYPDKLKKPSAVPIEGQSPIRSDIAGMAKPGAIGNGIPLIKLAAGILPTRFLLSDKNADMLREAIDIAMKLGTANEKNVPAHFRDRLDQTLRNLIDLKNRLTERAYIYKADIRSPEDYLLGFNFEDKVGFSSELVARLYAISPERLAQYVFHECVPEKGIIAERADHRSIYNEMQSAVFGKDEVDALKADLRGFINSRIDNAPDIVVAGARVSIKSPDRDISYAIALVEEMPVRAKIFEADLARILSAHRDQLFFIGIETDIGLSQKAQMMPMYRAIDRMERLTDSAGKRMFPNLMVRRAKAGYICSMVIEMNKEGRLNLNNVFIGARKASVDGNAYDTIQGEGRAWISAIDDSRPGDYLPVFEAITLSMMAYFNADVAAIKDLYDIISDNPIDPNALQEMLKNRLIRVLPKATRLDGKKLREIYEMTLQVYAAA